MPDNPNHLTQKQAACLALVAEGMTSKEIARKLGLSARTVDDHIEKARAKLNAPTRMRAAAIYRALIAADPSASLVEPGPYQLRREPEPVDMIAPVQSFDVTTPRLNDGGIVAFEHFPPVAPATPTSISPKETEHPKLTPFSVLTRIIVIAAAVALIALAYPQLVRSAEDIAVFIKINALKGESTVPR